MRHTLPEDSVVVVPATGNGLKDCDAVAEGIHIPEKTLRTLDDVIAD